MVHAIPLRYPQLSVLLERSEKMTLLKAAWLVHEWLSSETRLAKA
jgi:hypothetical protein